MPAFEGNSLQGLIARLRGVFYHRADGLGTLDYVRRGTRRVYASDTIRWNDGLILVYCTTANVTISLLDSEAASGKRVIVKKADPTSYTVTVDAAGGDHIDGAAGYTLSSQYARIMIESDGVGWWIIASGGTVNAVTFADSGALWALVWFGAGNGFPGRQRAQVRALSRAQLYLQGQSFAGR